MSGQRRHGPVNRLAIIAGFTLAGAGTGAIAATVTVSDALARAAYAIVGGALGLAGATITERQFRRREDHAAAMRGRDAVLAPVAINPLNGSGIFNMLLADREVAPFRGRHADLAWLDSWLNDAEAGPVALVTGPAGVGKTRLVTEWAGHRPPGWAAGWLNPGCGADAIAAVQACGEPALILVDDADQRPDMTAMLGALAAPQRTGSLVRVVLIARAPSLADQLARNLADQHRWVMARAQELAVGPNGNAEDHVRWFREAVRAYAKALATPPPDLPDDISVRSFDPSEPILTLQAQALLTVLNSQRGRPMSPAADVHPFDEVADLLFKHEEHRWHATAMLPSTGVSDLTDPVQAEAIAALLLYGPADLAQAADVLRRLPDLADASAERLANIARWASALYPADPPWTIRIKPDMMAEWFLVAQLARTPELAPLLGDLDAPQAAAALVFFAHASDHMPQAADLFASIVATDAIHLTEAAMTAAVTATAGRVQLDGKIAALVLQSDWPADAIAEIEGRLPAVLPNTRAAVAEAQVRIARGAPDADLAKSLDLLGTRLGRLGRHKDALVAAQEAVRLHRRIARKSPARQRDLATSLTNLGVRLGAAGRRKKALAVTEEAVGLTRRLAADNPALKPELAMSLNNLGLYLREMGRLREALAVSEESVGIARGFAAEDPSLQLDLAMALDNLGTDLALLGRHQEALEAAQEAARMYWQIMPGNPALEPERARVLSNLGNRLAELSRHRESLTATEEAVRMYRQLARDNPAAFRPELARSLNVLGVRLGEVGRLPDALTANSEAVALYRQLATDNPAVRPDLAGSLSNLSVRMGEHGRHLEALAAAEDAVALWRRLDRDNLAFQVGLATSLNNLGVQLGRLSRRQEAKVATEQSVRLYRQLAKDNPALQPDLAKSLGNLGNDFHQLGLRQEALAAAQESVGHWRTLARREPAQYELTYKRELAKLRRRLQRHGQDATSLSTNLRRDESDLNRPGASPPDVPHR
jgi:tetratricopeptide (TPR) repeat protein